MIRDLAALADAVHDVLVIGGGIYGACVAWEAVRRGLSVALVEKGDFGAATSANSLKVIHGGLRYLQDADLRRMRQSIRERRALMCLAPHLVHPLPVLVPTYGHGLQGREIMALALLSNDLLSFDRNRLDDPEKHLPRGRTISRRTCLEMLPGLRPERVTGGASFYDAQAYNTERLTLAFLRSAAGAGARIANYVEACGMLRERGRVAGITARDRLGGSELEIRARTVVNTTGPWLGSVLGLFGERAPRPAIRFAGAINLVTRRLFDRYAVGIASSRARHDVSPKATRFLFVVPWRDRSIVGTTYFPYDGTPDAFRVPEREITRLLEDANRAYPGAHLAWEDVTLVHGGLVPIAGVDEARGTVRLSKRFRIYGSEAEGAEGVFSVVGVKYTTARNVAAAVIDRVQACLRRRQGGPTGTTFRLHGGQIDRFDDFLRDTLESPPAGLPEASVRRLVYNYGSAYPGVLAYHRPGPGGTQRSGAQCELSPSLALLEAEIVYGVREEMACKLGDIIFRRTEIGTAGHPGGVVLAFCADVMSGACGWGPERRQQEIAEVCKELARRYAQEPSERASVANPAVR
jgi:glycerol-3-phosphate dehydrogenase